MDAAIYEPTTQKIFGVRGQWLFQFNSTTGALEQSARFTTDVLWLSSLVALAGKLYCAANLGPTTAPQWTTGPSDFNNWDMFVVDATTLTVVGRWNLFNTLPHAFSPFASNPHSLVADGSFIYGGIAGLPGDTGFDRAFKIDPTNIAGASISTPPKYVSDLCYDPTNGAIGMADRGFGQIGVTQISTFGTGGEMFAYNDTFNKAILGITYNTAQNKYYAVSGEESFIMARGADIFPGYTAEFTVTTLHTGRINANPFRIKSVNNQAGNPLNGKVLIPTWNDDAVVVWNPLTDAVDSVKTGFTAPFDVVSTPTKNWAVQTGTTGLKEIV